MKKEVEKNIELKNRFGVIPPNLRSLSLVRSTKEGSCIFLDCLTEVSYRESIDWKYYSKSYGKPKVTISNRYVKFIKKDFERKINIDNFRGDFIFKAYVEAFKIRKIKKSGLERKVQLDSHYRIKKIKKIEGFQIWERTLNKNHVDFCATKDGETFHDVGVKACLAGIKLKMNKKQMISSGAMSFKVARSMGFCKIGIESFCYHNDLNKEDVISLEDLQEIVRKKDNSQYRVELSRIGISA